MPTAYFPIVLAVDGTPASDRAVELLVSYRADASRLRVAVTNVQSRPIAMWPQAAVDPGAIESALLAAGHDITEKAVSRLRGSGASAESAVRLGFAADGIVREAASCNAQMILMGTRGHGALGGYAIGSVALRVTHANAVPVCLVRSESRLPAQLGRAVRVMLAADGSEPAMRAAEALASWQDWLGKLDVQIVYVQQPLTLLEAVLPPHDDVIEQWSTRAGEDATQPVRELFSRRGIPAHLHLTTGDPAREIVYLAAQTGSELLVMGTRGMGAAHHALVGSVVLKAAVHSAVPVVLVGDGSPVPRRSRRS